MTGVRLFRWLAVLAGMAMVAIIWLANSGRAADVFGPLYAFPNGDKVGHFLILGVLSLLVHLGFRSWRLPVVRLLNLSVILAALITLEECSQVLFADRTFSLLDLGASYAGIFLFAELGRGARKRFSEKEL